MKTIAQQLNTKEFPFIIKNKNGNRIYYEDYGGYWQIREFDKNGHQIYYEDSNGFWNKKEFNKNDNQIYFEDSEGYWYKSEYDENNNQIYFENSYGRIKDNRPKTIQEYTMEELTKILGKPFKIVK